MPFLLLLPLPLLFLLFFHLLPTAPPPVFTSKSIILLIAHPDDEAMFFSPTLLGLTSLPGVRVSVLCLSSGDADGLGSVRKGELVESCRRLGVTEREGWVRVVEDAELQDSMSLTWPSSTIADKLSEHADSADMIITFDGRGISGHPNHISLLHGAREFLRKRKEGHGVRLFTLTSVGIVRKYASILDAPLTRWMGKGRLVFVSTWEQVRVAQTAMTDAHKSQMRWFRWGWVGLSRYMVVNDLVEDKGL
ncbi:LmbE-like protein [Ascodesmis nigricans]|uniref:N-acetylglucosaminylphosphatidylinositol deacetylase n=1 Tax=Ascodesmis nigricans TaxID=341454 RepID=A0A4S2N812_9PEZI|nr:LmbE-like protein [Ascodesmis nigricans]